MHQSDLFLCDPADNVFVVTRREGLKAGARLHGFLPRTDVPSKHKVARNDIAKDTPVIRYGVPIALAARDIRVGEHVNLDNTYDNPSPPWLDLSVHPRCTSDFPTAPKLPPRFWRGFQGVNGRPAAARNVLGIMSSVKCSSGAVRKAVQRIQTELLPHFKNVDRVFGVEVDWGCGCAMSTERAKITQRQFNNFMAHSSFGAMAIVRLGCEKNSVARMFDGELPRKLSLATVPAFDAGPVVIEIQQEGTLTNTVEALVRWAAQALAELDKRQRVTLSIAELIVALQCGGSDALSGITANPVVGYLANLLAWYGARPFFTETSEIVAGIASC